MSEEEKNDGLIQEIFSQLTEELGSDYANTVSSEMNALQKLSAFTDSIEKKLEKLYQAKFPKKCNTCGRTYHSRSEYMTETLKLQGKRDTIFDQIGVQEYRNCVCGSTLIVLTQDRRDTSEFGEARRQLFDICVDKLIEMSGKERPEIVEKVRVAFRAVIKKVQSDPDDEEDMTTSPEEKDKEPA